MEKKKIVNDTKQQIDSENEIELFELFKKFWKWKWLIIVTVIFSTIVTFIYIKSRPDAYTVTATIKMGRITNLNIEDPEDFKIYLESDEFLSEGRCFFNNKLNMRALTCELIYVSHSPDESFRCMEVALKKILKRHGDLYTKGMSELKRSLSKGTHIKEPVYVLDSYNYPTKIIKKPVKPPTPDSKRIGLKIIVVVVASLFMGIFLSFFVENLSSAIRRRRN